MIKIKRLNKDTVSSLRGGNRHPTVRMNTAGLIIINSAAAAILGINENSKVEICQNEEAPLEWFIVRSKSDAAFALKKFKSGENLTFQNAAIGQLFVKSVNRTLLKNETSVCVRMGTEAVEQGGEKFFPLIPASAKEFIKKNVA